jgi:hypothetical protein
LVASAYLRWMPKTFLVCSDADAKSPSDRPFHHVSSNK